MKTTLSIFALPFLFSAPLTAQDAPRHPDQPGQDLMELFDKMHREGATEDDLRRMLDARSQKALVDPGAQRDHEHGQQQADRPAADAPGWKIGLIVEPVAPFIREHLGLDKNEGVRVVQVAEGSPAARSGIEVNDIVVIAGDKRISNLDDLKQVVERVGREGQTLKLGWIHKGERKGAQIRPDGPPPQVERQRDKGERAERGERGERAERADAEAVRPAMMRHMEEMARRMEKQQRQIEELRREIEKLKRESQSDE